MRIFILAFIFCALVACSSSNDSVDLVELPPESTEDKSHTVSETTKTGAALVFASEFAGSLSVGEIAPLVINLRPEYESGQLQISIQGQDGLTVLGQTEFSERFSGDYQFTHELMVGADQAGEYYLGIVANLITDSGETAARAFSETILVVNPIATLVGEATEALKEEVQSAVQEAAGETESVESYIPAIEEIITR